VYFQALCLSRRDELDNGAVGQERPPSPVHGDETEHLVLDLAYASEHEALPAEGEERDEVREQSRPRHIPLVQLTALSNALAETVSGLDKAELITMRGPSLFVRNRRRRSISSSSWDARLVPELSPMVASRRTSDTRRAAW
jgi:hypothetical protein